MHVCGIISFYFRPSSVLYTAYKKTIVKRGVSIFISSAISTLTLRSKGIQNLINLIHVISLTMLYPFNNKINRDGGSGGWPTIVVCWWNCQL
jgi:hypothetical protein